MKKKVLNRLTIVIVIVIVLVSAIGCYIYFKNNNHLKTINAKEVKLLKLFPSPAVSKAVEHSYDTNNTDDDTAINNIVNWLNESKSLGTAKEMPTLNGAPIEEWKLQLNNGQYIEIEPIYSSSDKLSVHQSNPDKIITISSPELRTFLENELQRLFQYCNE